MTRAAVIARRDSDEAIPWRTDQNVQLFGSAIFFAVG